MSKTDKKISFTSANKIIKYYFPKYHANNKKHISTLNKDMADKFIDGVKKQLSET